MQTDQDSSDDVFRDTDLIDFAIVGVGSAGGVLLQRLARAGFKRRGV